MYKLYIIPKYVLFRAWESIQQLCEVHCLLNSYKYYAENKANSVLKIIEWEGLATLNLLFRDFTKVKYTFLLMFHQSEKNIWPFLTS